MDLRPIATNQTEVEYPNGTLVFYSYRTAVAMRAANGTWYRDATKYSKTTTRHVNAWLPSNAVEVPRERFLELLPG